MIGKDAAVLAVGSYNLRCPCDPPPNDWAHRLPRVLRTLAEVKFDIFGTQETVPEYVRTISEGSGFRAVGHGREADKGGESATVFYDPKRLKLLGDETFWLSETPSVFSMSWGTTCPRIGTIGVFEELASGTIFVFANVHLQHMHMYECQKNQLQVMIDRLRKHYDRTMPVILTGDFNCTPDDPAAKLAASVFSDARRSAGSVSGPRFASWHAYSRENALDPAGRPIDYIFVSPGIRVRSFETVDDFDAGGLASSDHFPIKAVIELDRR